MGRGVLARLPGDSGPGRRRAGRNMPQIAPFELSFKVARPAGGTKPEVEALRALDDPEPFRRSLCEPPATALRPLSAEPVGQLHHEDVGRVHVEEIPDVPAEVEVAHVREMVPPLRPHQEEL